MLALTEMLNNFCLLFILESKILSLVQSSFCIVISEFVFIFLKII